MVQRTSTLDPTAVDKLSAIGNNLSVQAAASKKVTLRPLKEDPPAGSGFDAGSDPDKSYRKGRSD